jgi:hypothetical protein
MISWYSEHSDMNSRRSSPKGISRPTKSPQASRPIPGAKSHAESSVLPFAGQMSSVPCAVLRTRSAHGGRAQTEICARQSARVSRARHNYPLQVTGAMFKEAITFTACRAPRDGGHPSPAASDART